MQIGIKMSDIIRTIISNLENSLLRAKYYESTGDIRFLDESREWLENANIYMKEIYRENNVVA